MEPVNTEFLLQTLEEKVETHLREAIDIFQNQDDQPLLTLAANGGWSVAQCLEHLNRYGNFYLPELSKAFEKSKNRTPVSQFKSSWVGHRFTRMMDPVTGKTKYSAFKTYKPQPGLNAHQVVAEFIAQQEKLLLLLRDARHQDLNKVMIPMSVARFIRLKAGDVFQFIIAHNERHLLQAKRVLNTSLVKSTA
jgi:hypothetical protein